ncbi:ABC transporter ATP-binding protein [Bacillus sp. CGMCC 1.16607]|uniref:ABC transporter ATP-binding protein n=1 Tax=Bacillus sp. CGMCC 1.16607 TaxID=3351842 RepID=UPI00363C0437
MNPVLEVQDIVKQYGAGETKVMALNGVSLTLNKGEFVVVMGASGSGKSTFLQIVGGLEAPTSGKLLINGKWMENFFKEPFSTKYRQENIGFVFQFFNLLSSLTAEENIALPLLLGNESKQEMKSKTYKMLDMVGLTERAKHRIGELSGGQQQRVAIARALINQPPILLADEPTGNLDSKTSAEMLQLLVSMKENMNQSILLVTHDPMVATYADRVIFFSDGKIVKEMINNQPSVNQETVSAILEILHSLSNQEVTSS